jgi:hypothetical protein
VKSSTISISQKLEEFPIFGVRPLRTPKIGFFQNVRDILTIINFDFCLDKFASIRIIARNLESDNSDEKYLLRLYAHVHAPGGGCSHRLGG